MCTELALDFCGKCPVHRTVMPLLQHGYAILVLRRETAFAVASSIPDIECHPHQRRRTTVAIAIERETW